MSLHAEPKTKAEAFALHLELNYGLQLSVSRHERLIAELGKFADDYAEERYVKTYNVGRVEQVEQVAPPRGLLGILGSEDSFHITPGYTGISRTDYPSAPPATDDVQKFGDKNAIEAFTNILANQERQEFEPATPATEGEQSDADGR
jgi:hypothetical protein